MLAVPFLYFALIFWICHQQVTGGFLEILQVAEALLNPLGEDDDDFECNFLIDKNIATGMAIVDDTYDVCPRLLPDRFSDPNFRPIYSEDSHKNGTDGALQGSAEGIELAKSNGHVKMVAVDRRASADDEALRLRKASAFGRKLSSALGVPRRCHSIQPVHLSTVHQIPFDYSPQQVSIDLQNGDIKVGCPETGLDIVQEEDVSDRSSERSSVSKTPSNVENSQSPVRK